MGGVNWLDKLSDWGWQALMAIVGAAMGWFFYIERKIGGVDRRHGKDLADLKLHISDNYVKKTDIAALEQRIAAEFKEVKDGNSYIIDLLMQQKIGTKRRK